MAGRLWQRWKRLAHRAAEIQAFVVLTVLYWLVVMPIGGLRKLGRRRDDSPAWKRRSQDAVTIDDARRQF